MLNSYQYLFSNLEKKKYPDGIAERSLSPNGTQGEIDHLKQIASPAITITKLVEKLEKSQTDFKKELHPLFKTENFKSHSGLKAYTCVT